MAIPESVFLPDGVGEDGERFVATELARGPWDPNAQHGGAPAALMARAIERHEPGPASHVARLTIELLRPVPIGPLDGTHAHDPAGQEGPADRGVDRRRTAPRSRGPSGCACARRRSRSLDRAEQVDRLETGPPRGGPVHVRTHRPDRLRCRDGDRCRYAARSRRSAGATVWFRLVVPVVAGEETSPLMRVAAAADFGNGVSAVVDWNAGWMFINPDLTIYLSRYPTTEWVAIDAQTHPSDRGVGFAEAGLYDESGRIGRSVQSLLFDRL